MNISKYSNEILGVIGLKGSPYSGTDLYSSSSGVYVNDCHPLLGYDVLKAIAPNYEDNKAGVPVYVSGHNYAEGAVVYNDGKFYKKLSGSGGLSSPNSWLEIDPYDEWVKLQAKAGAVAVCQDWLSVKRGLKTAGTVVRTMLVGDGQIAGTSKGGSGDFKGLVLSSKKTTLSGRVVGFNLYSLDVEVINVVVSTDEGESTIYACQHEGEGWQQFNVKGIEFTDYVRVVRNKAYDTMDRDYAIDEHFQYRSCDGSSVSAMNTNDNGVGVSSSTGDFVLQNMRYDKGDGGIRVMVQSYCDYSSVIVDYLQELIPAFQLGIGLHLLRIIVNNADRRSNPVERSAVDSLRYEINEAKQAAHGLSGPSDSIVLRYRRALEGVMLDTSTICQDCLKSKRRGLKITSL